MVRVPTQTGIADATEEGWGCSPAVGAMALLRDPWQLSFADSTYSVHSPLGERVVSNRLNAGADFAWWFVGFFDGEGALKCESGTDHRPPDVLLNIGLKLTDHHMGLLLDVQKALGCGSCPTDRGSTKKSKGQALFRVASINDLAEVIIPLFERHPLRTTKRLEYDLWKKVVLYKHCFQQGWRRSETQRNFDRLAILEIRKIRARQTDSEADLLARRATELGDFTTRRGRKRGDRESTLHTTLDQAPLFLGRGFGNAF